MFFHAKLLAFPAFCFAMAEYSMVLAQTTDPISGGAGWVGAGLLGLVLAWLLLVHLPAKDKHIEAVMHRFLTSLDTARLEAKEDRDKAEARFEKGMNTLITEIAAQRLEKHTDRNTFFDHVTQLTAMREQIELLIIQYRHDHSTDRELPRQA